MKKQHQKTTGKASSVIAALCIIIYLFALVQASVRLFISIDNNRITAGDEFTQIKDLAITTGTIGFMDENFVQTINNALLSTKALEALIITGPNEEFAFEKQKGRAIAWVHNSPRFVNRMSFSNTNYFAPLPINNLRNANIKAIANAFDYTDISKILKETLLLILTGFSISFFTMLIQMLTGKPQEEVAARYQPTVQTSYQQQPIQQPIQQQDTNQPAHQNNFVPSLESVSHESGPKGLYSSRSNIGWEEYTKERLEAEIHRCASTEKDLTFITLEFANPVSDNDFKIITEDAGSLLSTKDMLFEFGNRGMYAILPGTTLDIAIGKSEKFYQKVMQSNPEYEPNIGLTSRSGRLVNADRLMLESKQAMLKAKADINTSIIAFKSDPDKYREYISRQ